MKAPLIYRDTIIPAINDPTIVIICAGTLGISNIISMRKAIMLEIKSTIRGNEIQPIGSIVFLLYYIMIIITKHNDKYVIRDDVIWGGTKMRALYKLMKDMDYEEFVYAGPATGFAVIAVSLIAYMLGKKATLYTKKLKTIKNPPILSALCSLPTKDIKIMYINKSYEQIKEMAEYYADEKKERFMFIIGKFTEDYPNVLYETLKDDDVYVVPDNTIDKIRETGELPKSAQYVGLFHELPVKHMYLVSAGGTVYKILERIFPKAKFHLIQITYNNYIQDVADDVVVHKAPERYEKHAKMLPPYDTVPTYDAKVWRYAKHCNRCFVYNIAGIKSLDNIKKIKSPKDIEVQLKLL